MSGGTGDDSYRFYRGAQNDTIYQQDSIVAPIDTGNDTVRLGDDIDQNDLWFTQNQNDLMINIVGTSDTLVINNWYADESNRVAQFELANGYTLLDSQVELLVNAMVAFTPPTAGQLELTPEVQDELNPVLALAWQSAVG